MKMKTNSTNGPRLSEKLERAAALGLLALAALWCQALEARAQWTPPDAQGNISNTNAGNVGIGTSAPTSKLTIYDPGNTTAGQQIGLGYNASYNYTFGRNPNTGYLNFTGTNVTSQNYVGYTFDGKVGIGTASPQSLLHLGGNGATLTFDTAGSAVKGRLQTLPGLPNWMANTLNANYSAGWYLDNPANDGWFFKLDGRGAGGTADASNGAWLFRVPPGQGPHTDEYAVFGATVDKAAVGRLTAGYAPTSALDVKSAGSTSATSGLSVINSSNVTNLYVRDDGNVGVGTTAPASRLHVVGDITVTGNINAKYQDVAEWVPASRKLAPGTVVVLDHAYSNQVTSSAKAYDTRVAGVVSPQPGISLGERGEGKALVATTGRVKVKADATRSPIEVGDLLVTSDIEGVAMKSVPVSLGGVEIHRPGTIIGKALEPLAKGTGEILVLLSLQ